MTQHKLTKRAEAFLKKEAYSNLEPPPDAFEP